MGADLYLPNDPRKPGCVPAVQPPEGKNTSTILQVRRAGNVWIGESSDPLLGNIEIRWVNAPFQTSSVRQITGEIAGWAQDVGFEGSPAKEVRMTISARDGVKAVLEGEAVGPSSFNGFIYGDVVFQNGRGAVGACQAVQFSLTRYVPGF
jgi:hypothetical protein